MKRFGTIRRNPVGIEPESEQPLNGDKENQEATKLLVN